VAICRAHNISSQTYYRWKSKYGGMGFSKVQRLRELERENTDLKHLPTSMRSSPAALQTDEQFTVARQHTNPR